MLGEYYARTVVWRTSELIFVSTVQYRMLVFFSGDGLLLRYCIHRQIYGAQPQCIPCPVVLLHPYRAFAWSIASFTVCVPYLLVTLLFRILTTTMRCTHVRQPNSELTEVILMKHETKLLKVFIYRAWSGSIAFYFPSIQQFYNSFHSSCSRPVAVPLMKLPFFELQLN